MILVCLPDDEALVRQLAATGQEGLIARRCADLAEVIAGVEAGLAHTVLVSGDEPGIDLTFVAQLRRHGVRVGIVPIGMSESTILALGAQAVPEDRLLDFVRTAPDALAPAEQAERGRMIAVWGPGGSVGRSAFVRDMASVAGDVVVVDGDTHRPSLAQLYGVEETSAIVALARHIERGREPLEMVDSVLVDIPGRAAPRRRSGRRRAASSQAARPARQRLLVGLNTGERWRELPRVVVDRMWEPLVQQAATMIVDLSGGMDARAERVDRFAVTRSALAAADVVLHVGLGSPVGLRRFIEHVDAVGGDHQAEHRGIVIASAKSLGVDGAAKVKSLLADAPMPCTVVAGDPARLAACELEATPMPAAFPRSPYSADVRSVWESL